MIYDFVFFVSLWLIMLLNGKAMCLANNLKCTPRTARFCNNAAQQVRWFCASVARFGVPI